MNKCRVSIRRMTADGVCWDFAVLRPWRLLLQSGDPALVTEILDPCEAILVESAESPGGWAFYGNLRMMELFASCGIRTSQD